jgi:hypothetical protein
VIGAQSNLAVMAVGFWLPAGRSNFFDPNRKRKSVNGFNGYSKRPGEQLTGYEPVAITKDEARLNASVYWRLISVLPSGLGDPASSMRYSCVYPLYNVESVDQISSRIDPDAILMTCRQSDLTAKEWDGVRDRVRGIALLAVADGYYVCLALYDVPEHAAAPDAPDAPEDSVENLLREALTSHIAELVGGNFSSRAANPPAGSKDAGADSAGSKGEPTLAEYRDHNLGMLSFFQIHLIFEGLFNAALDPRVFLDKGGQADAITREYSLGSFVSQIVGDAPVGRGADADQEDAGVPADIVGQMQQLLDLPTNWEKERYFDFFKRVRDTWMNFYVRRELLRQFLRYTSTDTLQLTKWRIESCSRLLLSNMISVAHLRRPLVQAEIPTSDVEENNQQEKYVLVGANEAQLRGYVMLLAAKLPLIETVHLYLRNNRDKLLEIAGDLASDATAAQKWRPINGLWRSWDSLLDSIRESVRGLEQALEQAHMDDMLAETKALRDEEETRAEIERIQERTGGGLTANAGVTVNLVANVVAAASVLIVVASFVLQVTSVPAGLKSLLSVHTNFSPLNDIVTATLILAGAVVGLIVIFLALALIYLLAQIVTGGTIRWMIHLVGRWESQNRRSEERYYYEMDLDLDVEISDRDAETLFSEFAEKLRATGLARQRGGRGQVRLATQRGFGPERTSYHINRASADAARHKIYIAATVNLPPSGARRAWTRWRASDRMRIYVVYEVLFHTPSLEPQYQMEKVRIVSTNDEVIDAARLDALKRLVVEVFVNPWIKAEHRLITSEDAFFSLRAAGTPRARIPAASALAASPTSAVSPLSSASL